MLIVTALRTLAKTCNFCDCMHDSIIRDRIVLGIKDKHTRKRLLQERKLTLKTCIDLCKSNEATNVQLKQSRAPRTKIYTEWKINIPHRDVAILTDQRKTASEKRKPSREEHANFVAEHIASKKASVQHGEPSVQSVVAEIISKRNAPQRLRKSTASSTSLLTTATWNTLPALLYNRKQYRPSRKQLTPKKFTLKWSSTRDRWSFK